MGRLGAQGAGGAVTSFAATGKVLRWCELVGAGGGDGKSRGEERTTGEHSQSYQRAKTGGEGALDTPRRRGHVKAEGDTGLYILFISQFWGERMW